MIGKSRLEAAVTSCAFGLALRALWAFAQELPIVPCVPTPPEHKKKAG